jgi:hypothetical protein
MHSVLASSEVGNSSSLDSYEDRNYEESFEETLTPSAKPLFCIRHRSTIFPCDLKKSPQDIKAMRRSLMRCPQLVKDAMEKKREPSSVQPTSASVGNPGDGMIFHFAKGAGS